MKLNSFLIVIFAILCSALNAQTIKVTGVISDTRGSYIPFATVAPTGAKGGVTADANGNYTINTQAGKSLTASAVGFLPQTMTVVGGSLNFVLNNNEGQLSEVIVTTALGIKREAKELGYSATTVSNKVLTQAKAVNVQQALNGKVSGLSIATVNSGVFESAKINIRGIRSLTGNNQPMLVVDGAPTPLGYLSSIPPDDVQDITILKSAASAAIYGPDAVNGVIIISTKKGTGKRINVSVSSSVQLARVAFFPKLQKEFGGGAGETVDMYGNYGHVPYENQHYGPAFDGSIKEIGVHLEDGSVQTGPYTNEHYKDKIKFWNTGVTLQNSVSVAGQDFYASVEDANVKGLMPKDINRRTSFRFNGGKKSGGFSINYGLNYVQQNYDVVNESGLAGLFPGAYNGSIFFLLLQTPNNIDITAYKDWRNDKFSQPSNYYNEYAANPYWVIDNVRTKGRNDNLIGNLDLSYQFAPWLRATARMSSNLSFGNFKNTTAPVIMTDWAVANRNATQYSNRPGNVFDDQFYNSRLNFDYFLNGEAKVSSDLSVKYLAGGSLREERAKDVALGGNNLVVPFLYNVSVRSGDASVPTAPGNNFDSKSRLYSAYGTMGLGYKGWAFLEVTGRNDWDSRLLKQNRSFFYPAANASLVLSDAINALKNSRSISYAKVRAAWSKSGNVNLPVYSLNATYSQPAGFPYGNTVGFTANQTIPNADLKPEFVYTKEIGLELGFLKNRIDFGATYFNQQCDNQVLQVSQSVSTGYTIGLANAASFKNYGVELDLGLNPLIKTGKGRLDFKINATYNNNEVTSTLNDIPVVIGGTNGFIQVSASSPAANNIAVVGKPAFAYQLTDYTRDPATGKVIVDAVTGLPSKAAASVVMGRSLPLWVVGFTPTYTLGNFSASMTWDYKTGHNFYSGMGSDEDFAGISSRSADYGRQRFVFPNSVYLSNGKYVDNTNVLVQDGNYGFWAGSINTAIATNYFASAAAWRLREVNLSYNVPLKWIGNGKSIQKLTVSVIGRNLLMFVPKSNQWGDPEFNFTAAGNTFGISSSFQSPSQRLFGGSVTVQF
ncbi:MAG: SusC/RagA family TonB-linked outer membrane protein [Chitinophagaceae bacterium]|nr:SusC/RagA family TonB-linked outer membrane protein [Chitinophagaceae bacterium]